LVIVIKPVEEAGLQKQGRQKSMHNMEERIVQDPQLLLKAATFTNAQVNLLFAVLSRNIENFIF
jgi:hypothetical protein